MVNTSAADATVSSVTTNAAPPNDGNGYAWISYFRGLAGLAGVARSVPMESQEALHVRYLANYALPCETDVHNELVQRLATCGANAHATLAGRAAATNSDITRVSANSSDRAAVSSWFVSAFHALTLLDPRLSSTGYAAYYTPKPTGAKPIAWPYTAGADVYRGRGARYNGMTVAFPANNASTPLLSYTVGSESPEPFRTATNGCKAWGSLTQVSAPVMIQWPLAAAAGGAGSIVDLTTGVAQPTCSLDANAYPAGSLQQQILSGVSRVTKSAIYYAQNPFVPGHRYQLRVRGVAVTTFWAGVVPTPMNITGHGAPGAAILSWSASASGIGGTPVYQARAYPTATCGTGAVAGAATNGLATKITGLVRGRVYYFRVAAVNSANSSRWSPCVAIRST